MANGNKEIPKSNQGATGRPETKGSQTMLEKIDEMDRKQNERTVQWVREKRKKRWGW